MSKKKPPTDPPMSVRVRKIPTLEDNGMVSEFAVFMTDLDGNVTVAKGQESDRATFRTEFNQLRNDDRRASKAGQIRHHHEHIIRACTASAEYECLESEFRKSVRQDLKRVLSGFKRNDPARSVLAHVLSEETDWQDSKTIADKLGLSVQQVTTAKRKIHRRINNNFPALRKHLGRASEF